MTDLEMLMALGMLTASERQHGEPNNRRERRFYGKVKTGSAAVSLGKLEKRRAKAKAGRKQRRAQR